MLCVYRRIFATIALTFNNIISEVVYKKKPVIMLFVMFLVIFIPSASFAGYVTVYKSSYRETCVVQETIHVKELGRYYQATVLTYPKQGDSERLYKGNVVKEITQIMAFDPMNPEYKYLGICYHTPLGVINVLEMDFYTQSYQPATEDIELYTIWKYVTEYVNKFL